MIFPIIFILLLFFIFKQFFLFKEFFMKNIFILFFLSSLSFAIHAQQDNQWVIGFSTAGHGYNGKNPDTGERYFSSYHELVPHLGYRVGENFYAFIEGGRSFHKSTENVETIPTNWFLGSFTRWYMIKHHFLDIYSGVGVLMSTMGWEDGETIYTDHLSNPKFSVYGGLSFRLYKGLHIAGDWGYQYVPESGRFLHRKITLQYAF